MSDNYRLDESVTSWTEVDDGIVVLDLVTSTYLTINDSGRLLWLALQRGARKEELQEILVSAYGITTGQASTDVDDFLGLLGGRGYVRVTR